LHCAQPRRTPEHRQARACGPPEGRHGDNDEAAKARQAEAADKIQAFHDQGDQRGAAASFLSGFGLPPEAVNEMLDAPGGEMMIDSARALPYDYALVADGLLPNKLATEVAVPTLVMAAEGAPKTAEALVELMPNGSLQVMPASARDLAAPDIANVVTPFPR
jgi:hypothetical protein